MNRRIIIVLLWLGLVVLGCSAESDDLDKMRIAELESANMQLTDKLSVSNELLLAVKNSQQGLVAQQIVAKEVKFAGGGETLEGVRDRRVLRCGGNADLPGFGYLDPDSSEFVGFDIDFCRAIAAGVLGDQGADRIDIVPLTSKLRFATLQSGDIDVLTRNTTWTMTRDTELASDFAAVTFYDGQGVMVRGSSGIKKLSDLQGKAICVQEGSTSATNIADYFDNIGITIELREFRDRIGARNQYEDGGCDAYTGDKSSLIAQQTLLIEPSDHKILVDDISREPLGPVVRHGDENWRDIVSWTVQCMLNGEALGVNIKNVDEQISSEQLPIKRLLGVESELGPIIGLPIDFCYQIIRQVGNYADVYDRHLGSNSEFKLSRGYNALYTDGGLMYPLPFK